MPESVALRHLAYLDGWRGIAIITLLLGHFTSASFLGQFGVEIFFVLSGRLISDILFVKKLDLPTFFFRRFSRIWPALFCCSLFLYLASVAASQANLKYNSIVDFGSFIAAIAYFTNYYILSHPETALAHTWSIAVEEHAYVALALIATLIGREPRRATWVCATIAIICMINGALQMSGEHANLHDIYWRSDVRLASILISAAMFLGLMAYMPCINRPAFGAASVMGFVAAAALHHPAVPLELRYTLGSTCLAASINFLEAVPAPMLRILQSRILTHIGILSFSIYLWQQPFANAMAKTPGYLHPMLFVGAIISGVASFYCLERPARRLLNMKWDERSRRMMATETAA